VLISEMDTWLSCY